MHIQQNFDEMTKSDLEKSIKTMRETLYHHSNLNPDTRAMITDVLIQAKAELVKRQICS